MENLFATTSTHVTWNRAHLSTWTDYHANGQTFDVFASTNFQTMPAMFREACRRHPHMDLLVDEEGNRMTFTQVVQSAEQLARALLSLKDLELKARDRVGVCGRNSFDWVIAFMAASFAGMIVVPFNSWWTSSEMDYAINLIDCKVIFADVERLDRLKMTKSKCKMIRMEGPTDNGIYAQDTNIYSMIEYGKQLSHLDLTQCIASIITDEPAMMMFTSGTTNHPKAVLLSHRGVCHTGSVYDKILTLGKQMVIDQPTQQTAMLMNVPLFHATGLYAIFFASLLIGRKVVIMKKWNAEMAMRLIERERVTHFTGVPTMVLDIMNHPNLSKYDISSMKNVGSGGAPPPEGVAVAIQTKLKASPAQGFGLTEVNCLATTISAQDYLQRPGSCGKPVPGVVIQIWSEETDGKEMPRGQQGRIAIRGPTLMLEYWRDREATNKAITRDGWFLTGDFGSMDVDGFLFISGRSQDLLIRGGENISARAVEEAVFAAFADSVQECAVFGYPHPTLGEEVGCAIYMKHGCTPPTIAEIRTQCTGKIAKFMLPTGLAVFDEPLPRGATGKTLKKEIKQLLKDGKLSRVWTGASPAVTTASAKL